MKLENNTAPLPKPEILPEILKSHFLERGHVMDVGKGHLVLTEGDLDDSIYWIQSGGIRFSLMSLHGREVILRDLAAGSVFGESAAITGLPRSVSGTAVADSTLYRLSSKEFRAILSASNEVSVWLSIFLALRVTDLTARVFELATLSVAGRVQLELLKAVKSVGSEKDRCVLSAFPTHSEFAAKIGTHREAVTRELNALTKEGIVQKSGRAIEVVSVKKLRKSFERFAK